MQFPRSVALLLIAGLIISSASFGESYPIDISENPSQDLPASRDNLTGLSGGEQNIDPFTVHPVNRWDSSSSGPLTTSIENGELSLETYLNDSSESYYFRESSTADDTISIRWRLNQTADMADNETDFYLASRLYGPDGMSWQENVDETCNWGGLDNEIVSGGIYNARCAAGANDILTPAAGTLEYIDTSIFEILNLYLKTNDSELILYIWGNDSAGTVRGLSTTQNIPDTNWNLYSVNLSLDADWTGIYRYIFIIFDEDDGTLDGDEGIWVDYIRITGDSEYQGDFSIPLCGLNATTSEGSANTTLTAFQYNGTHYTVRPSFTTGDGTNSRSWNLDANYQDYPQLEGLWGTDGWDFTEENTANNGVDGWDGHTTYFSDEGAQLGYWYGTGSSTSWYIYLDFDDESLTSVDSDVFSQFQLKFWSNVTLNLDAGSEIILYDAHWGNAIGAYEGILTARTWHTITLNLTADADWSGTETDFQLNFQSDAGTFNASSFEIRIDYIRLLTQTTDDREFFEFNEYYRSELDYDLRSSELEFELQDDLGDDIVKEEIGELSISNYFDADDLIPDVFQAKVGQIDYLLGVLTAGNNGTCWWDYYQAAFQEHNWELYSLSESGDDFEGKGPYGCHNNADGGTSPIIVRYELVIPEFDSASGRLVIDELNGTTLIKGSIAIEIYTVSPDTGAKHFEADVYLVEGSGNKYAHGSVYPGNVFEGFNTNNGREGFGEITFSFFLDKIARQLNLQMEAKDDSSTKRVASATWDMTAGTCNEIIFRIEYTTTTNAGGSDSEISLKLDDWSFTRKDILGGIAQFLGIDDDGGFFSFLLWPIIAIVNILGLIPRLISDMLGALGYILSQLTSLEGILGLVKEAIDGIGIAITGAITSLETALGGMVDTFGDIVSDALGLIETAIDGFTTAIAALAAQIWTAITSGLSVLLTAVLGILQDITDEGVNFIRGIGVGGTTIGDVLDLLGSWLNLFVTTVADTLEFTVMMLTTWVAVFMTLIFIGIIFFAIAGSQTAGEVPGKIFAAYSTNILPISIWGFKMHVPLVVLVIPYVFIVVLGVI